MTQSSVPLSRRHLPTLDAVRGVAILGVFCYHLLAASWGNGAEQLKWAGLYRDFHAAPVNFLWFYPLTFGWVGVSLFFVLSGFVIHYSTITSKQTFSAGSFYSRRFWRIYPPYAVAVIIFFLVPSSLLHLTPPTRVSFFTHALLVQDFSNSTFALINPSFWSIATEVQFYLVYPALLLLRHRINMSRVLMLVLAFSFLSRVLLMFAKRHAPDSFEDSHLMLWTSPMITIFDWTLGAFLAERFAAGKRVFPAHFGCVLVAAALFLSSTLIRPASMFSFQLASLLSAVCIEHAIWTERRLSAAEKLLVPLGLCSYSFYLFHQPILNFLVAWIKQHFTGDPVSIVLAGGPAMLLLIGLLSAGVYQLIEKPSMRLGRRFSNNARKISSNQLDLSISGTAPVVTPSIAGENA